MNDTLKAEAQREAKRMVETYGATNAIGIAQRLVVGANRPTSREYFELLLSHVKEAKP